MSGRKYRTPRFFEQKARPHKRTLRQLFITDLGHDEPTILLTANAQGTFGICKKDDALVVMPANRTAA